MRKGNTEYDRMGQTVECHRLIIQNATDYEKLWLQCRMQTDVPD